MKRARNNSNCVGYNQVLNIVAIIDSIGRELIPPYLTKEDLLKFTFNVYPDTTMKDNAIPEAVDETSVLIETVQYELLINTHPKVLATRLKDEEFVFRLNTGKRVSYTCTHFQLNVNEDGYAEWTVYIKIDKIY